MDDFLTDQQRAEQVRHWLRDNWIWLVAGVVLGLGGLGGWNLWRDWQDRQAEAASAQFENLLKELQAQKFDAAEAAIATLIAEHGGSPYADQARLAQAGIAMERNDLEKAVTALRAVESGGRTDEIRHIARLRLARVLAAQEKYEAALALLKGPEAAGFAPAYREVRGDIYSAMGKREEARSEYEQALQTGIEAPVINRPFVQAKLDDLGGATTAPKVAAPAAPAAAPPASN